jgi:hypothetical protein
MDLQTEVDNAIAAHGMWKRRLRTAIDAGQSEWSPEGVRPDNLCAFGKWLYSLPPATKGSAQWMEIRALHADFHVEAARVLQMALEGRRAEAEAALAAGSKFGSISSNLVGALMSWKKKAA